MTACPLPDKFPAEVLVHNLLQAGQVHIGVVCINHRYRDAVLVHCGPDVHSLAAGAHELCGNCSCDQFIPLCRRLLSKQLANCPDQGNDPLVDILLSLFHELLGGIDLVRQSSTEPIDVPWHLL